MKYLTQVVTSARRSKSVLVLLSVAVFLAVAISLLFGLYVSAKKSDELSAQRQRLEIHQAISNSLNNLAQAQEGAAVWDMLAAELGKPTPDWQWIDRDVGQWLQRLFKQDQVFILAAGDKIIYGSSSGNEVPASEYAEIESGIRRFVDLVRGRETRPSNPHERLPGQSPGQQDSRGTTSSAVHATDLGHIQGRPAAISVMRIVPLSADARGAVSGQEPLLVSIRFLDGSFLQELERDNMIDDPHFHRLRTEHADEGEYATPIGSSDGASLGYMMWRPDLPGSELWRWMLPLLAATLLGFGAVIGLLAYFTYQLTSREERNFAALQVAHMELQASEAHAHHLAFHDVLTGLPNRAMFNTCVEHALVRARGGEKLAILLLDLDRFKHVNDTWGHLAGDSLIQEVAIRLSSVAGSGDTVARLGGDEFAILAMDGTDGAIATLAERILEEARRPFDVLGNRVFVGLSMGVALAPQSGTERAELLRKADIALYRAKAEGRNTYRLFSESMDETVKVRAAIEKDLREALANGRELEVHYQPQIDSEKHELTGVEALTRWNHPTRGSVPPALFVPIAEETGLIDQLGDWVLGEACRAALQWPTLSIAVNLSPVQFRATGFAQKVTRLVTEAGVDPRQIELEITEGVLVDDDERVRESLERLRHAGFRIALDDFGTGYSSLSYLRKFEVDKIKIDRSFVHSIGESDSTPIVTAVVTLGHAMGLTVTAEGVETTDQRDFLRTAGCNEFQGYLFSKAVPENEITQMLLDAKADQIS